MHACVCTYAWHSFCACACVCMMTRPEDNFRHHSYGPSTLFFETGLSLAWGLPKMLWCLLSEPAPQEAAGLCLPRAGMTSLMSCPVLVCGSWGWDSGPHPSNTGPVDRTLSLAFLKIPSPCFSSQGRNAHVLDQWFTTCGL